MLMQMLKNNIFKTSKVHQKFATLDVEGEDRVEVPQNLRVKVNVLISSMMEGRVTLTADG